ncbi:MAG: sulfatase, partial [Myxococcota bacterium]
MARPKRRAALAGLAFVLAACTPAEPPPRPNVLLVTLDTTRADRLGAYGNPSGVTPNLDRLAAESIVYTHALAPSSWTLPSHASLFTGKFTSSHGARYDPQGPLVLTDVIPGKPGWERIRARGLEGDQITLATLLSEAGYATGAVVAGPWLMRVMGLDAGFAFYSDAGIESVNGRLAADVTDTALAWLSEPREPFFLFLNYFDAHAPFSPPAGFLRKDAPAPPGLSAKEARRLARYEGEIRYMDHHLGRLLAGLRELGLYDSTWILVTADHGEALGEHGTRGHGSTLYQEVLHVPLIMRYPHGAEGPARRSDLVQLVDLLPTILHRLALPTPPGIQGSPIDGLSHPVVAEVYPLMDGGRGALRAQLTDGYKFLWRSDGRHQLFDVEADPGELEDLLRREPRRAARMARTLSSYLKGLPTPPRAGTSREVSPETREA